MTFKANDHLVINAKTVDEGLMANRLTVPTFFEQKIRDNNSVGKSP